MTKTKAKQNVSKNNLLDRAFMGVSFGIIVVLAVHDLVPHIKATEPMNWALASTAVGFLLYLSFAPTFRK